MAGRGDICRAAVGNIFVAAVVQQCMQGENVRHPPIATIRCSAALHLLVDLHTARDGTDGALDALVGPRSSRR